MEQDILVAWEDRYSMGITAIDEQHKKLFEMTNSLYDACLKGEEPARRYFKEVIHDAVNYVQFHFTSEERLMERLKFPGLAEHKEEHTDFVRKVLEEVWNWACQIFCVIGKISSERNPFFSLPQWRTG
jgi:hemerythrin